MSLEHLLLSRDPKTSPVGLTGVPRSKEIGGEGGYQVVPRQLAEDLRFPEVHPVFVARDLDLGFGVWSLGSGVQGLVGVWGLGIVVEGSGFGVCGLGFGVWGLGFRGQGWNSRFADYAWKSGFEVGG